MRQIKLDEYPSLGKKIELQVRRERTELPIVFSNEMKICGNNSGWEVFANTDIYTTVTIYWVLLVSNTVFEEPEMVCLGIDNHYYKVGEHFGMSASECYYCMFDSNCDIHCNEIDHCRQEQISTSHEH